MPYPRNEPFAALFAACAVAVPVALALAPATACTVEAVGGVDAGTVSGPGTDTGGTNGNGNGNGNGNDPDAGTSPGTDAGGTNGNGNGNGNDVDDCTPGGEELLTNGNFDASTIDPWTLSGQVSFAPNFPPQSPDNCVGLLGGQSGNPASALLKQRVEIPSGTTSLALSFHLCTSTQDTSGESNVMTISVEPASGSGDVFETLDSGDVGESPCNYVFHEFEVDPSARYDGEAADLVISAETPASRVDTFYLDTFSLIASCP